EFLAHGGKNLLSESMLLARPETGEERGGKHIDRNRFIDRRLDCPSPFTRVLNKSGVLRKRGILGQRHRCKIEQPGTDYASPAPHFGNVREIQIVALLFAQFI